MNVITEDPLNAEPDWADFREPITPNFFHRNHYSFPTVAAREVEVCGRVFKLEELYDLPQIRQEVTLECAGNGRLYMEPLPPGTAWGWRGVSHAAWTGVSLAELLRLAPPPQGTLEMVFQGGDLEYARSLTLAQAMAPEVLVAHTMNDQPLATQYGGPLRLLVPGAYAVASVKWLTNVRPSAQPFTGYYQAEDYQFQPAEGPERPVGAMQPRAMIVSPCDGESASEVIGWAWSGFGPIEQVTVVVDGQPVPATLEEPRGRWAWRGFRAPLKVAAGEHEVYALARDASGREQPLNAPWNKQGYENNSAMKVRFRV